MTSLDEPALQARRCPGCGSEDDSQVLCEARLDHDRLGDFAYASRKVPEYMHHRLVACPRCQLVYASPAPLAEALDVAYRDAAYDSGEEAEYASDTYGDLLGSVMPELPDRGGALDIGAGNGAFLRRLLAAGIDDVVGVEPSAAPVAAAADDVRPFLRLAPFRADDFEPGRFRLVTVFQTLEHVADPLELCRAAHRLLAAGGALMVVCHNRRAVANRLLGRRSPIFDVEHLQLFSPESLRALLERAGFDRVELRPVTNRYPLRYWVRLLPLPPRAKDAALATLGRTRFGSLPVALPVGNFAGIAFKAG
jgi:SAM-dependent methyltransferase